MSQPNQHKNLIKTHHLMSPWILLIDLQPKKETSFIGCSHITHMLFSFSFFLNILKNLLVIWKQLKTRKWKKKRGRGGGKEKSNPALSNFSMLIWPWLRGPGYGLDEVRPCHMKSWFHCWHWVIVTWFSIFCGSSKCSLSGLAPLEAVLFDIDGTLCDSDPLHYYAFRELLLQVGFSFTA